MLKLSNYEQIIHDQVVAVRARQLGLLHRVIADSALTSITCKNDLFPDIIVLDDKNNVLYLEEVTTESTVTKRERDKQWLKYSKLGYPFNIIVPKSKIAETQKLIRGLNINKLYYYELSKLDIKFRQLIK